MSTISVPIVVDLIAIAVVFHCLHLHFHGDVLNWDYCCFRQIEYHDARVLIALAADAAVVAIGIVVAVVGADGTFARIGC